MHRNVRMKFLTCEPNLFKEKNYVDEADMFYEQPEQWFILNRDSIESITHLVIFEHLYKQLKESTSEVTKRFVKKFFSCEKFFYSFALSSNRLDTHLLLCKLYGKNTQQSLNKSELWNKRKKDFFYSWKPNRTITLYLFDKLSFLFKYKNKYE